MGGSENGLTLGAISAEVAKEYSVRTDDLWGDSHRRKVSFPRHVAWYLARRCTDLKLHEIGSFFHRHHSTVHLGVAAVKLAIKHDSHTAKRIEAIATRLETQGVG